MAAEGELCVRDMMRILRDHGSGDAFDPGSAVSYTLCMHAGAEDRPGQTVNSMVSEIARSGAVHWVTGTASPCTSIFKPVLMDAPAPVQTSPAPADRFDPATLWWRHERLHRAAVMRGNFTTFIDDIRAERDAAEVEFRARISQVLNGGTAADRAQVVASCWAEALALENEWNARLRPVRSQNESPFVSGWTRMNRLAGLDLAAEGLVT
jgi:dipeptidase